MFFTQQELFFLFFSIKLITFSAVHHGLFFL